MEEINELKKETFKIKLERAKLSKSSDWTLKELEKVLSEIDMNKSRDSDGINRSIFQINCNGEDLKHSLLIMFNKLKRQGQIPGFMKNATISTIPKPGSKFLLKNERGIVVLVQFEPFL